MKEKTFGLPWRLALCALALFALSVGPSLYADGGANHQGPSNNYGVSGGNVKDISRAFCCSGTLGSLVTDGTKNYILSNNHVLARSDQAAPGEDISQPGLIDNSCRPAEIVANFTVAPKLGSNVDAAIAELRSGAMNANGTIEDVGVPSDTPANPAVGMDVAKSGRTSGFTTGTITSTTTSVKVQYQKGCNSGKKFTVSYTDQVVVGGGGFSAGGDSGSLIVTDNACHQPVALLYAGSSTSTIGNPISEVLTRVSSALGRNVTVTFVGQNCVGTSSKGKKPKTGRAEAGQPSDESVGIATRAMRSRERDLMSRPEIIGIGVGSADDGSTDAAIVVYVDINSPLSARIPRQINGVRVRRVFTEPFVAY